MYFLLFLTAIFIAWKPIKILEYIYRTKEYFYKDVILSLYHKEFNIIELTIENKTFFLKKPKQFNIFSSVLLNLNDTNYDCTKELNSFVMPNSYLNLDELLDFIIFKKNINCTLDKYSWNIITNKADFIRGCHLLLKIDNNLHVTQLFRENI